MKVFFVRHGQTQANVDNIIYTKKDEMHPLTERGIQQAIHTGKYLKKFCKFDLIISSPRLRTIQTADLISKELNYDKKIIINDLIVEDFFNKVEGLNESEINDLRQKNKKISKLTDEIRNTNDPFKKNELIYERYFINSKEITGGSTNIEITKKLKKFLNSIKKLKEKCILVVTHGGIMNILQSIITNTYSNVIIYPKEKKNINPYKYEDGNTMIMACKLEKKTFKLVIPNSTYHLDDL